MKMLIFQKNELIEGYGKILRKYKEKYELIRIQLYEVIGLFKTFNKFKKDSTFPNKYINNNAFFHELCERFSNISHASVL